jgi:hypothetical protein
MIRGILSTLRLSLLASTEELQHQYNRLSINMGVAAVE